MLSMTRRTFDLWLTILSVVGGGAATFGAVWVGARLALAQDRGGRNEERRELAIGSALAALRRTQRLLDQTVAVERRPVRIENNISTLQKQTHSIDAERLRSALSFRASVDSLDEQLIDSESFIPEAIATNRSRVISALMGVAAAVELPLSDDRGLPSGGHQQLRAEILQAAVNATVPVLDSAAELLVFAAKRVEPPFGLDVQPLDEFEAFEAAMRHDHTAHSAGR